MHRSILSAVILIFAAASSAGAAQTGQSGGGLGFECPPDDELCRCDGTYTDCNNMKVVCVDGTMQCKREGDIERCWCQRKTSAIRKLPDSKLRVPTAPALKQ